MQEKKWKRKKRKRKHADLSAHSSEFKERNKNTIIIQSNTSR